MKSLNKSHLKEGLKIGGILVAAIASVALLKSTFFGKAPNNLHTNSVMIVNRAMNHGGTGVIVNSGPGESTVLTNDHVCRAIKNGGVVKTNTEDFQITSMIESELSDLCFVQVATNLGINTSISSLAPQPYERAIVAGHPALMPNVISTGHFSGRRIIQVMTGFRPCTDAEDADPLTGMVCAFFGGMPVVKSFESVLVTATIMPGSSGSGVYNAKRELSGLVFAGNTEFGYAWTVPYEQLVYFTQKEHQHLKRQDLSQELNIFGQSDEGKHIKEVAKKCSNVSDVTADNIVELCNVLKRDMTWVR